MQTSLKEDKRQYTGDVCVNAVGDVVAVHAIFAGKTEKSLPSLQVRNDPRLAHFKFSVTTNHWADHTSKVAYVQHIWSRVVSMTEADNAAGGTDYAPRCILMLDCWPVNLTDEFRSAIKRTCPGMRLMFVPAGATGRFQVGRGECGVFGACCERLPAFSSPRVSTDHVACFSR